MGGKDAPLLLITDKNGVRTLMFNRPAQLNGWSPAMMERIEIEMRQAGNDDNVKALIVTGNGRYYSAGADFAGSIKPAKPSSIKLMAEKKNEQLFNNFIDFPKPLIAAINGPALGASVTSARLCDVIVTSENASFVTPFNKIGVVPEGCSSRNFPKIFGEQGAKEMFDGKVLTPEEALRVGFVEYVVPPGKLLEKAQEVAEEWIAQGRQRTCIEQGTVDELRKINAIESKALGNALLDYPFLDHMTQFTYQKSKYAAFVIFWIARTTRPLWSNL